MLDLRGMCEADETSNFFFFLNQTNKSLDHVQCSVCRPFLSTAEEVPCHVINGIVLAVTKART